MGRRYQILCQLADGRFHSGEALAHHCGVSRAAVCKHVARLRDESDLVIHAVRGKGYRLARGLELLREESIHSALTPEGRARLYALELCHSIESTNTHLLRRAADGACSGHACLAECQTAGRARRGRPWISPFGCNIYLSVLWRFSMGAAQLSGLSLAAGLAVVKTLERLGVKGIGLKWPNDLLWDGRKLAGLLLELSGEHHGPCCVVLGLGINTGLSSRQGEAIDQPWVALREIPGGEGVSRNRLAAALLGNLLETMDRFDQEGFGPLVEEWLRYDLFHGRPVTIQSGSRQIEGVHSGIDTNGALLLEQGGNIRAFHGGEVSLRLVG